MWGLFLYLQDLETQKAKLAALHEDISHFKSSQPTTSDSQGDVSGPSLRSQGAEEDLGQVIPPRAAEQSSSQPPNSMEEEIQAVVPSASPSSSNSHSTLSLPTSSSDEARWDY